MSGGWLVGLNPGELGGSGLHLSQGGDNRVLTCIPLSKARAAATMPSNGTLCER